MRIREVSINAQCSLLFLVCNHSLEIRKTKVLAAMLEGKLTCRGGFRGRGGLCGYPPPSIELPLLFHLEQLSLPVKISFVCFFKVFPENFYKVQVTLIYNLLVLLLSAQTYCQKWLSKCWKCHLRDPKTRTFPGACPGTPEGLGFAIGHPLSTILAVIKTHSLFLPVNRLGC